MKHLHVSPPSNLGFPSPTWCYSRHLLAIGVLQGVSTGSYFIPSIPSSVVSVSPAVAAVHVCIWFLLNLNFRRGAELPVSWPAALESLAKQAPAYLFDGKCKRRSSTWGRSGPFPVWASKPKIAPVPRFMICSWKQWRTISHPSSLT